MYSPFTTYNIKNVYSEKVASDPRKMRVRIFCDRGLFEITWLLDVERKHGPKIDFCVKGEPLITTDLEPSFENMLPLEL